MVAEKPNLQAVFNEALARDAGKDRGQYLAEACGDDPEARDRIEALLRAHGITHVVTATPRNMNSPPAPVPPALAEVLERRLREVPLDLTQVRLFVVPPPPP